MLMARAHLFTESKLQLTAGIGSYAPDLTSRTSRLHWGMFALLECPDVEQEAYVM